ncbi:hypothetical protein HQ585_05015 [candidate division KSB1 bacterium]|nr:hypothetical protein [candidate division KSB1 bacterium]
MKRFTGFFLSMVLFTIAYGQKIDFVGDQVEFTVKRPNTEENIKLKAEVPKGWKVNPDFGTVVFEPGNALDFYEPPNIEFQAMCEGECKAEAMVGNIEGYIQRLKDGWKQLSTGNEELDKLGANVEILKEEKFKGHVVFAVKLTYPDGVSDAMYPPRYWIYRFLHNDQDPFFILIKGKVPVNLGDEFLSDIRASCLSTAKL